jgi:hypothetical protein
VEMGSLEKGDYRLVHAYMAITRAPLDNPAMPGFVSQPTPPDEGSVFTGGALLNLSIWQSVESLDRFTHGGKHARALKRRGGVVQASRWAELCSLLGTGWTPPDGKGGQAPPRLFGGQRTDTLCIHLRARLQRPRSA